jgi:hypothetical protein
MCKQNNKIQNQNNYVDLEQRYIELLRVHNQLMGQSDEICPDCMYTQLLSNTSQSIDLLDDLKNEIDNESESESESEIIADCKLMDEITKNKKNKNKNKIIITFE